MTDVFTHFSSKKAFASWNDEVLRDYIEHGTHDARRQPSFPDGKTDGDSRRD